ncbi:hypothetical protein EG831_10715, partial [bacterium]|nr:hypothetical protein [bacterium]
MNETHAILMMAYGGPDSLEDVAPYLSDVRGGRPTPPELAEEIRRRYAAIGGKSPLLEITQRQAGALETALDARWAALEPLFFLGSLGGEKKGNPQFASGGADFAIASDQTQFSAQRFGMAAQKGQIERAHTYS